MPKSKPLFSFVWKGRAVGVNHRYADKGSKRLNPAYTNFKHEIRFACTGNPPTIYTGELWLRITMHIDPARDSDSLLKPLFDGMEEHNITKLGCIKNDNQIRGYSVSTYPHKRGEQDRIETKSDRWLSPPR
jgi:Holliday junction resolvase RusA-like endonuclease